MWFSRPDGVPARNLPPLRRIMPFLMPGRNEAVVTFELTCDLSRTIPWLEQVNRERSGTERVKLLHIVLAAMVRTLTERPDLHRFVAGWRVYQRKQIEIAFAVKPEMQEDSPITTVKIPFEPGEPLLAMVERIQGSVSRARGPVRSTADKELAVLSKLPSVALWAIFKLQRMLDALNLLPKFMIDTDPLYSSVFVANLGSIGLDAAYHHLYEYGTVPLFCVIGKAEQRPVVAADGQLEARTVLPLRFTFDERITDGFSCARGLELFRALVEQPERLG